MTGKLTLLLLPLLALLIATGCGDEPLNSEITLYDIVKLESQKNSGANFLLGTPGTDRFVTLYSKQLVDTTLVHVGDRLLISYTLESGNRNENSKVRVFGYSPITNGMMKTAPISDTPDWDKDPVYLMSAWRTGEYLNIHARLPYDQNPRLLALICDTNSADPAYPDLYLAHAIDSEELLTFDRAYYISFDISGIAHNPDIKGFTLHLNNSNLRLDTITYPLRQPK